jgi:hypothetical protein
MNPDYEKQLEAEISRELKALPELAAPPALAGRILTAIEQRHRVSWYRRSWVTWPPALQAASFAVLAALFAGLCLESWQLAQSGTAAAAAHRVGEYCSWFNVLANTLAALTNAAILAVKKLGPGFMAAGLLLAGMGYALCVGLGTVYFRLGFAKR